MSMTNSAIWERLRERRRASRLAASSDAEWLAILLRTGVAGRALCVRAFRGRRGQREQRDGDGREGGTHGAFYSSSSAARPTTSPGHRMQNGSRAKCRARSNC